MSARRELQAAFEAWNSARQTVGFTRSDLDAAIVYAVRSGVPPAEVASTLGWSNQRVNQVLKERSL